MRDIISRSSVVLLTAYWEAFCEDLASEAIDHLVNYCERPEDLPVELRKAVARRLKNEKHELAVWGLAGDNWRKVLEEGKEVFQAERLRGFNTPKAATIDNLFRQTLGIRRMSDSWTWQEVSAEDAREKLDRYIVLRGEIAHRGAIGERLLKAEVKSYWNHVHKVAYRTVDTVNSLAWHTTGKSLLPRQPPTKMEPPNLELEQLPKS